MLTGLRDAPRIQKQRRTSHDEDSRVHQSDRVLGDPPLRFEPRKLGEHLQQLCQFNEEVEHAPCRRSPDGF